MLFEIHFLSYGQDFRGFGAGDDYHAVSVGGDDIAGLHFNPVTLHGNIGPGKTIVANGCRGHNAGRENRESDFAQVADVAHAAVDHGSSVSAGGHGCAHQPTHSGDVRAVLHHHHPDGFWGSLVDGGEHAAESFG